MASSATDSPDTHKEALLATEKKALNALKEDDDWTRVWIVDGEPYDLTDFLHKHPGGPDFLLWCAGRDISVMVHTYHKNPKKTVLPRLKKYKIDRGEKKGIVDFVKDKIGIPNFLLPPGFDAAEDIPTYNFDPDDEKLMLNQARKKILEPEHQKNIARLDNLFDVICASLWAVYFSILYSWLSGNVPWYIVAVTFAVLKTSIAGCGHYYIHRSKPHVGDCFFDFNYVGMSFTAQDGHVLIHHAYTQSDADVKRGFFGGMMGIPRIFRIPIHTLQKFLHVVSGTFIRGIECEFEPDNNEHQGVARRLRETESLRKGRLPVLFWFWAMQVWLRVELALAIYHGVFFAWFAQFFLTLWVNTLMVVSSHDFELDTIEGDTKDWARYQVLNAHDMSVVGNPWIDCFLSAGLSPHRSHHVFPYQRSGFANYYSNRVLKEVCEANGIEWKRPKSFFLERAPIIANKYIFAPICDPLSRVPYYKTIFEEHTKIEPYLYCLRYIWSGVIGIGSI